MSFVLILPYPRNAPRPPRPAGDGRWLEQTAQGQLAVGPPSFLRHAAVVLAGAGTDIDVIPEGADPDGPWRAALDVDDPGESRVRRNRSMQAYLRSFSHDGTRQNAGLALLGPDNFTPPPWDPNPYNGMPADIFYDASDGDAAGNDASFLAKQLARALPRVCQVSNPTGRFVPAQLNVCVDVMYSTKEAVEDGAAQRYGAGPPLARTSGQDAVLVEVPLLKRGEAEPVQNEGHARIAWAQGWLDNLRTYFDEAMPTERSGRVLDTVVAFYIWAAPLRRGARRRQAVGGYIPGGAARIAAKQQAAVLKRLGAGAVREAAAQATQAAAEDVLAVPKALLECRGLVASNPALLTDGRCLARAIVTALDPLVYACSDAALVSMRRKAEDAARAVSIKCARAIDRATTDPARAAATVAYDIALERCAQASAARERAEAAALKAGWHVRPTGAADGAGIYRAKARWSTIEEALSKAYAGAHSDVDFSPLLFQSPVIIDASTVLAVRSAFKDGAEVAVQFWGVGTDERIALVFPDPRATLDFLDKGGRVINIFYGYCHASAIRSVTACCNHRSHRGAGEPGADGRVYCPLCGYHESNGVVGGAWELMKHAERGCEDAQAVLPAPLSEGNRVQLGRTQAAASVFKPCSYGVLSAVASPSEAAEDGFVVSRAELCVQAWHPSGSASVLHKAHEHVDALLHSLTCPEGVDELVALWSQDFFYARSRDDAAAAAAEPCCRVCCASLAGPSTWDAQAEELRAVSEGRACCMDTSDTERLSIPCSNTTTLVHTSCAAAVRKARRATLSIFCTTAPAFAAAVRAAFSRSFIEGCCGGDPPSVQRGARGVRRVSFACTGTDGRSSAWFNLVLLPAFFGDASATTHAATAGALGCDLASAHATLDALTSFATHEQALCGLWPLAFTTLVSFNRAKLLRSAIDPARPGDCPTAIATPASLASARKLVRAGYVWTGERAEWGTLDLGATDADALPFHQRFLLDINAAYPDVFLRHAIPFHEHADAEVVDYSAALGAGLAFLGSTPPSEEDRVLRLEVEGSFPPSTHAALRALPPLLTSIEVTGEDLSAFQRSAFSAGRCTSIGKRTLPHLMPVKDAVVFLATAQLWLALGFKFTRIGKVWATPARRWGAAWAQTLQTQRQAAAAAGEKAHESRIKLACNSTLGGLCMNVDKLNGVVVRKAYSPALGVEDDSCSDSLDGPRPLCDDDRCTLRTWTAGDCTLFEMRPSPRSIKPQMLLAAAYVVERARTTLLELFYGCAFTKTLGLRQLFAPPAFKSCRVVYAATDALLLDVETADEDSGVCPTTPLRALLQSSDFAWRIDASNSSLVKRLGGSTRPATAPPGTWGAFKDETGFVGIDRVVVNGPNRWGATVVQGISELFPRALLRGLPEAWKTRATFEEYAASWRAVSAASTARGAAAVAATGTLLSKRHHEEEPDEDEAFIAAAAAPRLWTYLIKGVSRSATEVRFDEHVRRGHLSVWRNPAAIVTAGGEAFPLGSSQSLATAAQRGDVW